MHLFGVCKYSKPTDFFAESNVLRRAKLGVDEIADSVLTFFNSWKSLTNSVILACCLHESLFVSLA